MNWEQARRLLHLSKDEERSLGPTGTLEVGPDALATVRASSICVASGKGGTGKSVVSASLSALLAERGRTLLVDADLGVGNAHILHDAVPRHSFVDVVSGNRDVSEIVCPCRPRLDLLAGGSGYTKLASLSSRELHVIAEGLERLEIQYRHLVVDSAAGISNQTISFAAASDVVVLVTTPDLTALTDVYAFFKVLLQRNPACTPLLVVNRAVSIEEARAAYDRLASVSRKYLGREPRWVGMLPEDRAAFRSIQHRTPVVLSEPAAPVSLALVDLLRSITAELLRNPPNGLGRTLLRRVGYSPALA